MQSIAKQIRRALALYREKMAQLTKTLVAIPTENPPGRAYAECAGVLVRALRSMRLEPQQPRASAKHCLLAVHGKGERTLYFHGHYDVVPAPNESQFRPFVRRGCLFGRGAADMKGGLVAMLFAVKVLQDLGIFLAGRIGLVFVPDEETGGARGSQALEQAGLLGKGGIGMLTPEPTGGAIWNASRGAISLCVTVKGKPAHVGLECRGINAFEHALDVAADLRALKKEIAARRTKFRISPEAARKSILMLGGRCEGGTNFNLVPADFSFSIDRRINPEESYEDEKKRLLDVLRASHRNGASLEWEIIQEGHAAGVSEKDPLARTLARSAEEVTGKSPAFEMCPGLLETRFYATKGVPALAYGPGLLTVSHGPNEFVRLRDIENCAAIYALTALKILGAAPNCAGGNS
jgi:acetylornithine deacetylase/succinyl-diaminopimelate desuccinylase family protein